MLFVLLVLGAIARLSGFSIIRFIAYIKDELLIVLGTSSSETVLPQMIQKMEHLGASRPVVGLVIPTGYSFNLDGTNIYMTLATLFLAQATNTHLTIWQELGILGVAIITSKGASGVTGAGFITLAATLSIVPDIPIQSIAILVGIDKFMSECRALTNLIGNGVACIVISRSEGELDKDKLHETMAHPIELGEALEPGAARRHGRSRSIWRGGMTKSITIYGIKNCDTMKKARAWLDGHGVAYDFHDYKTAGIAKDKLKQWSDELGWETLLNRAGTTFQQTARQRQGRPERAQGAGADAGAAVDDQAAGARSRRQIAGRVQAGDLREGSGVEGARAQRPNPARRLRRKRCRSGRARHEFAVDDGPDQDHGHGLGLQAHQVVDLEAALDADALVGADDLFDGVAAAERQQQPLVGHVLAVGVLHHRDRIGRPLVRQAGAVQRDHVGIAFRPDRVVEIAVGPLRRVDVLVAVGGGQPGAFLGDQEARAVALADDVKSHHVGEFVGDAVRLEIIEQREAAGAWPRRAATRSGDRAA